MVKDYIREILITLVMVAVVFFGLRFTIQSSVVVGPSMEPSLYSGQRLLVNKVVYELHEPRRGDIITFHAPNGDKSDYIKRVIGLPGDVVEIKNGTVYVNGSPLTEIYIVDHPDYNMSRVEVPANDYFVLGDNRNRSNDSHNGWLVPRENIIGNAWLSIWPPNAWGLVDNEPLEKQLSAGS